MSTDTNSTASRPGARAPAAASPGRARTAIVAFALAGGALATTVALLWHPWPPRNDLSYAAFAGVRDAAWAGLVLDGLGFAVTAVALALAVCLLTPARGAIWANVGAVLGGLGGLMFGTALISQATFAWYATATDAISVEAGTSLLSYAETDFSRIGALLVPGFLMFTLGTLLMMVALWRARSVPRWLPIVIVVLTLAAFVGPQGRALDLIQAVQGLSLAMVAWFLLRATTGQARNA